MRTLVVDDDETFCRMLVEFLEEVGLDAAYRTDGLHAFDLLMRERYDVCIIDVRMPLVLGSDLVEAIKEAYPRIKIILVSAFPDEPLQKYAARRKVTLLGKPFTENQLMECLRTAVA